MDSMPNLHVIAFGVAGLAALALGSTVRADLAVHDVAGVGLAVAARRVGLLLDHQLAVVPARLGRSLAARAVLLHEAHLALALVVELVVGTQAALALRRRQTGARAPVAFQERQILLLLRFGRHDHRLGRVLGIGLLVVALILVGTLVLRTVGAFVGGSFILGRRLGNALAVDSLAVAALDRNAGADAHDHAVGADDAGRAVSALAREFVGEAGQFEPQILVVLLQGRDPRLLQVERLAHGEAQGALPGFSFQARLEMRQVRTDQPG